MNKRRIFIIMAVIVSLGTFTYAIAAEATARTVSIFKVEGKDVKMTKGTEKEFAAKAGIKLFGGYTVSTGANSYAYLKLDEDSLIKMDEKSKIKVNKQTSKKLSVSVLSGGLAVDAATQTDGKSMEIRAGNSALAIRGTYFVAEITPTGTKFTMFEGSGVMSDGTEVPHGKMLIITEEEDGTQRQELVDITITGDESEFLLQNIIDNAEMLKDSGILTDDDLDKVKELLDNMPEDTEAAELAGLGTTTGGQKYYSTESPSGGGNGSGSVTPVTPTSAPKFMFTPASGVGERCATLVEACNKAAQVSTSTVTISPFEVGTTGAYTISEDDITKINALGGSGNSAKIVIDQGMSLTVPPQPTSSPHPPLTVNSFVTVENKGKFNVEAGGKVNINGGIFNNESGTGQYAAEFNNSGSAIISYYATFENSGKFTNNPDGTVEIVTYSNFKNNAATGRFINNNGYVGIHEYSEFNNYGEFKNEIGTPVNGVSIWYDSSFNNLSGASLTNGGAFYFTGGWFTNDGTINNSGRIHPDGGTVFNNSLDIFNDGIIQLWNVDFTNLGSIENSGEFSTYGDFTNDSGATIEVKSNNGRFYDYSIMTNSGDILIKSGAEFEVLTDSSRDKSGKLTNGGNLTIESGGSLTLSGEGNVLSGLYPGLYEGTLLNSTTGTLKNEADGTVTVSAYGILESQYKLLNDGDMYIENGGSLKYVSTQDFIVNGTLKFAGGSDFASNVSQSFVIKSDNSTSSATITFVDNTMTFSNGTQWLSASSFYNVTTQAASSTDLAGKTYTWNASLSRWVSP